MVYSMKNTETTAAVPRVVDAHSLPHCKLSNAARACVDAVRAALRVSPKQRDLVRPLVLPHPPVALQSPQKRFADLVGLGSLRRSIFWLKSR
jgi:hypothetical protein